jgi:hypothetical protein
MNYDFVLGQSQLQEVGTIRGLATDDRGAATGVWGSHSWITTEMD